jgi:phosphopantothenoylcysteine decarboxylase/phosphopantothenate--cysteine ligase
VSGPVALVVPKSVESYQVETAAQMFDAIMAKAFHCDIYIGAAAVADYRPVTVQAEKIKKNAQQSSIILQKTQDILATVASLDKRPFTVGFAAETDNLESYAQQKLHDKNLDMIAANWVGREQGGGFDSEQNALQVFWHTGQTSLAMMDKTQLAEQFILLCAERFNAKNTA